MSNRLLVAALGCLAVGEVSALQLYRNTTTDPASNPPIAAGAVAGQGTLSVWIYLNLQFFTIRQEETQ